LVFKGFVELRVGATSRSRLWEYMRKHKKELDIRSHGVIGVFCQHSIEDIEWKKLMSIKNDFISLRRQNI